VLNFLVIREIAKMFKSSLNAVLPSTMPYQSRKKLEGDQFCLFRRTAQFIGFSESPPAYASLPPNRILGQMKTGINFASGGSGLNDLTGNSTVSTLRTLA
jgi:hypothetical protein